MQLLAHDRFERMWRGMMMTRFVVLSRQFPGRTEENILVSPSSFRTEIWTRDLKNMKQDYCQSTANFWYMPCCLVVGYQRFERTYGHGCLPARTAVLILTAVRTQNLTPTNKTSRYVSLALFVFECYHNRASYCIVISPVFHIHSHWSAIYTTLSTETSRSQSACHEVFSRRMITSIKIKIKYKKVILNVVLLPATEYILVIVETQQ
jgi:hypothetical protein